MKFTRLRGVLEGEELGNAIGDDEPAKSRVNKDDKKQKKRLTSKKRLLFGCTEPKCSFGSDTPQRRTPCNTFAAS